MPTDLLSPRFALPALLALGLSVVAAAIPTSAHAQRASSAGPTPELNLDQLELDAPIDYGTHPDEGLMIAGGTIFTLAYLIAPTVLLPLELRSCNRPPDELQRGWAAPCEAAPRSLIPFAHVMGGGVASIVGGSLVLAAEVVGLFMFLGGAAHHHPIQAPSAPQPGEVSFADPIPGAEASLGIKLHL